MKKDKYREIEKYMLDCMKDSAHDKEHIYRVLYLALDIAEREDNVDMDVLIAASLLHDIGRQAQFEDDTICHAQYGAQMAFEFLSEMGFDNKFAAHVSACISSHRFRSDNPPASIEAKILFDADKLDAAGAMGIARTLLYQGHISTSIYSVDADGRVLYGTEDENDSFMKEYNHKLKNLYNKFYTSRGMELAKERQGSAIAFYKSLLHEAKSSGDRGLSLLASHIIEA